MLIECSKLRLDWDNPAEYVLRYNVRVGYLSVCLEKQAFC